MRLGPVLCLLLLFSIGLTAALALGEGERAALITTKGGPKPGAAAKALARSSCIDLRQRVGQVRFTKTFGTSTGCRAIMAGTAQSAIVLCGKRYPAGSTADAYCIQLAIAQSPVERAASGGLKIVTRKTVTYIPVPTAGPGAGTGSGTGAGTGGGIPGSHA